MRPHMQIHTQNKKIHVIKYKAHSHLFYSHLFILETSMNLFVYLKYFYHFAFGIDFSNIVWILADYDNLLYQI